MSSSTCWHCSVANPESLFCQNCSALQAPSPDYYRFFGFDKRLDLDIGALQKRFYELSKTLHPDRFTRRTEQEKQFSLEATAILNDGFRVLRDPVLRAEYILKEEGFEVGESRKSDVSEELLEEVFELNLALEDLKSGDSSARAQLEEAQAKFMRMREQIDADLLQLFHHWDANGQRETLGDIRKVLSKRRYITNLLAETGKTLAASA